ncbi:DUF4190 domain-containing protein [Naumannella halotolerans]|uniref:Uncharacterized protein DUF4190 n=1 Tax=Naumannella halotolerans TaxID=993414 RepID=A0A4R7JA35_9ACTN|nr:DUF4190 domain-containing protein [Naumannella halotolerans]TDT34410.1 uncharacterized protein DUF4190 [Naumannella halotolerans]
MSGPNFSRPDSHEPTNWGASGQGPAEYGQSAYGQGGYDQAGYGHDTQGYGSDSSGYGSVPADQAFAFYDPYGQPSSGYSDSGYGASGYAEPDGYGQPSSGYSDSGYGASGYAEPDGYGQPSNYGDHGYGQSYQPDLVQPAAPYPYLAPRPTNALAIVSLCCGLGSFVVGISWIVGIITGHLALRQIARTGEQGHGLAVAGLIVSYLFGAFFAAIVAIYIVVIALAIGSSV